MSMRCLHLCVHADLLFQQKVISAKEVSVISIHKHDKHHTTVATEASSPTGSVAKTKVNHYRTDTSSDMYVA